jgi:hypothetical protein
VFPKKSDLAISLGAVSAGVPIRGERLWLVTPLSLEPLWVSQIFLSTPPGMP